MNNTRARIWAKSKTYKNYLFQLYTEIDGEKYIFNGYVNDVEKECLDILIKNIDTIVKDTRNIESTRLNRWASSRSIQVINNINVLIPILAIHLKKVNKIKTILKLKGGKK